MHKWVPCHREVLKRSHVDKTILLLKIENKFVPIVEAAVKVVEAEPEVQPGSNPTEETKESVSLPPLLPSHQLQRTAEYKVPSSDGSDFPSLNATFEDTLNETPPAKIDPENDNDDLMSQVDYKTS